MSDLEKLVLLGLHTQPTSAVVEIDALVDVVAWAQGLPKIQCFLTNTEQNRLATLKYSSLAILMLAETTSQERRQLRAGIFYLPNFAW